MNEVMQKEIKIENMIYEVRGKQVMLDRDVALLYEYETKRINEIVKRNRERFSEEFCFQLNNEELSLLNSRSQNATLNRENIVRGKNIKYLPYVFTEHGIMMLAGMLKSNIAIEVSKQIINTFISMRTYISNNLIEQRYINKLVLENHENIKILQSSLEIMNETKSNNGLFFEGQIYDAYSLLIDIFESAKESIIVIDNYIDKSILDILRKIDKQILIITNKYNNEDYEKYKKQYSNINLNINNKIHDRFIIIDNEILYHSGSSFKDLGKKCFAINKIENKEWLDKLLELI